MSCCSSAQRTFWVIQTITGRKGAAATKAQKLRHIILALVLVVSKQRSNMWVFVGIYHHTYHFQHMMITFLTDRKVCLESPDGSLPPTLNKRTGWNSRLTANGVWPGMPCTFSAGVNSKCTNYFSCTPCPKPWLSNANFTLLSEGLSILEQTHHSIRHN